MTETTFEPLSPEAITELLTHPQGFRFARWDRPIVPVIFGAADESLPVIKGAIEAVVTLAGHRMAETDPEMGANLMVFFLRDWAELKEIPDLDRLAPSLAETLPRLEAEGANQYRLFRFDPSGAIRAHMSFLRLQGALAETPAEDLALMLAVNAVLLWGEGAFDSFPPLLRLKGASVLRPELAALIAAAYDKVLPLASQDPSLALRLAARLRAV